MDTKLRLIVAVTAAFALAACGGADDASSTDDARSTSVASTDTGPIAEPGEVVIEGVPVEEQAIANLEVRIENVGASKDVGLPPPVGITCTKSIPATCTETIECPVADDANDPAAQQVCGWLREQGADALAGEPDGRQMCTQLYGGPEVATVTGTLEEQTIDVTFSREDGCAIARFDAASTLWIGVQPSTEPVGGGAAGSCLALPPDTPVSSDAPASGGAADEVCATPAEPGVTSTPTPAPAPPAQAEPDVISDPPEAFDLEQ
jgi:hypothetical protein